MNSNTASKLPYLHELPDFKALLEACAFKHGILEQLIEKDYWVMHCLSALTQIENFSFAMKGGTTLSKAYGIISRFSEDIDIRIPRVPGVNHKKDNHTEKRRAYFDNLATHISIPGIVSVERDSDFDDLVQMRHAGIRLVYPSVFSMLPTLKTGVLLEIGFGPVDPTVEKDIDSWAYRLAIESGESIRDNRGIGISCYRPEYTFVEKLQAISTKFRGQQAQESGSFPPNFLRHYYDIYCLLEHSDVQQFIGTQDYIKKKEDHFRNKDNTHIATNEAFLISDPEVFSQYAHEYSKIQDLFYAPAPTFQEIMARIHTYVDQL